MSNIIVQNRKKKISKHNELTDYTLNQSISSCTNKKERESEVFHQRAVKKIEKVKCGTNEITKKSSIK